MAAIFHDRPMSALDTAVYWVEYVIKHGGAQHLRSPAVELSWYQYRLLDVFSLTTSVALSLILPIRYFINKKKK